MLIPLDFSPFSGWLLVFFLGLGLVGLFFGGEFLCRGAASLARLARISPLVIGLTVVSIATSMPEMFTSLAASLADKSGMVIGNIVGSNISNIALILGAAALISPLAVESQIIRQEMPILVALTMLFFLLALGGLARVEGLLLLGLGTAYCIFIIRQAKQKGAEEKSLVEEETIPSLGLRPCLGLILGGTLLLSVGADLLVQSSSEIALRMGVSDVLIGLTLVAIGTSLPELATSLAAAWHRHADICVGNLIGSNLFNIVLIGGGTALLFPFGIERMLLSFEFPVMLFLTFLLWPFVFTGKIVSRREGLILLLLFGAFLWGTFSLRFQFVG